MSESVTTRSCDVVVRTGTGTLTIKSAATFSTTDQLLTITADDFDIYGGISSGTANMWVVTSSVDHTIGIGGTARDMHITDAEFAFFSTDTQLTIGDSNNGVITLDGVTDGSTDDFGRLYLTA